MRPGQNGPMAKNRRAHREVSLSGSHWRADGAPKARFPNRADAERAAAARAAADAVDLGVNRCSFCGAWHLGGTDPRWARSEADGPGD